MVRAVTDADLPRVSEIHVYGWRAAYAGLMSEKFLYTERTVEKQLAGHRNTKQYWHDVLVFESDEVLRGFSFAGPSRSEDKKDAWELYAIYVEPAFKFHGAGSALIRRTEELAREHGKSELILWVLEKNNEALRFYRKHGFTEDGGTMFDKDLGLNEIRLSKLISL